MIKIHSIEDKSYVNSRDLYKAVELCDTKYSRWVLYSIQDNPVINKECVEVSPHEHTLSGKRGGRSVEYYVPTYIAIGICIFTRTPKAKKVKDYIVKNMF